MCEGSPRHGGDFVVACEVAWSAAFQELRVPSAPQQLENGDLFSPEGTCSVCDLCLVSGDEEGFTESYCCLLHAGDAGETSI